MRLHLASGVLALSTVLCIAGCSGGSGGSSASGSGFVITGINVLNGQEWKINRPIDITFNQDVDFSTVNLNTINISNLQGLGATGFFTSPIGANGQRDPRVVRFQPACPTEEDNSDAGLAPFSDYKLTVLGSTVGGLTVRSTAGDVLDKGRAVNFHTPDSNDPLVLFLDTVPGPPAVRIRGVGGLAGDELAATHVEIGGLPVYFALDPIEQEGRLPLGFKIPLNHYSIPENQISVILHLNQPVLASETNISQKLVTLEYFSGVAWTKLQTRVELIENCSDTGASIRLTPAGIVPQERELRVVLRQGFSDITGDTTTADAANFALMDSIEAGGENPLFPGVGNPEVDGVLAPFTLSGDDVGSLEDTGAAFEVPPAKWGTGQLQASFAFGGTGGPKGTFDWHIPAGTKLVISTVSDTIVGGENGVPETTQAVINGVIDVRDVFIPQSSSVILMGPNTATILASGTVRILGEISIRGSNSPGVSTLGTANQPEEGAPGQGGGGDGGTASFLTNQSTPRGGRGLGAFNTPGGGGEGGETSYFKGPNAQPAKNNRRGGGGGGGRFGTDTRFDHDNNLANGLVRCQTLIGLDAEPGAMGGPGGTGAESQSQRAVGGEIGPEPFLDKHDDNNFFGVLLTSTGELITGELQQTHAGAGGGAGGDAVTSNSFPLTPWNPSGDEKGSGGGGGAGGLRILAIGPIIIGDASFMGSIAAEGGDGGAGENSIFFDRVGGGSGGGSGGHIVLSSAAEIVIWGKAPSAKFWYTDNNGAFLHNPRSISAVGGGGGAGRDNFGGANENGPTNWRCDRIPFAFFEGFTDVPPVFLNCFNNQPDIGDAEGGPTVGAGGDGSPGIIQFHVEDPATRLRFPTLEQEQGTTYGNGLDVSPLCAPPPLGWHTPFDPTDSMLPFFGRRSRSQSKWIALGLARIAPVGTDQVVLRFGGVDASGFVPHAGGSVDQIPPIVGPTDLGSGGPPFIGADERTMVFDAASLSGADLLLKQNPQLLLEYSVQLADALDPAILQRFRITAAEYDASNDLFVTHVDPDDQRLTEFAAAGTVEASLVPHFLRVLTNGITDSYPADTSIQVAFDATKVDPLTGLPSEASHGFTNDISDLNFDDWDFFRFQVEFDLDLDSNGVDLFTPRPGLDILRVTFGF